MKKILILIVIVLLFISCSKALLYDAKYTVIEVEVVKKDTKRNNGYSYRVTLAPNGVDVYYLYTNTKYEFGDVISLKK
jgi:uncharacterized protein YxeA